MFHIPSAELLQRVEESKEEKRDKENVSSSSTGGGGAHTAISVGTRKARKRKPFIPPSTVTTKKHPFNLSQYANAGAAVPQVVPNGAPNPPGLDRFNGRSRVVPIAIDLSHLSASTTAPKRLSSDSKSSEVLDLTLDDD